MNASRKRRKPNVDSTACENIIVEDEEGDSLSSEEVIETPESATVLDAKTIDEDVYQLRYDSRPRLVPACVVEMQKKMEKEFVKRKNQSQKKASHSEKHNMRKDTMMKEM